MDWTYQPVRERQPVRGERILLIIGMPFLIFPVHYAMIMDDRLDKEGFIYTAKGGIRELFSSERRWDDRLVSWVGFLLMNGFFAVFVILPVVFVVFLLFG